MKRAKFESVFINHLGNPVYCTEDEIKEQYIKQLLVPWFIIAKRFGLPKDLVKMITGMLGKGYRKCPIWRDFLYPRICFLSGSITLQPDKYSFVNAYGTTVNLKILFDFYFELSNELKENCLATKKNDEDVISYFMPQRDLIFSLNSKTLNLLSININLDE